MIKSFHKENGTLYFNELIQELFILEGNIYDKMKPLASTRGFGGNTLPESLIRKDYNITEQKLRKLIDDAREIHLGEYLYKVEVLLNNIHSIPPHTITVEYDGEYKWETLKAEY